MIIKITCTCNATFEIKNGSMHPSEICCPNCGQALPSNASADLLKALDALETFDAKLDGENYNASYSMD